jgi:hypothetical protein
MSGRQDALGVRLYVFCEALLDIHVGIEGRGEGALQESGKELRLETKL